MAKFNVIQKGRRAAIAERKREKHGDPLSKKLKQKQQPQSMSGKRKRKLFKKWRKEQKEALAKGLITMEDVEMAVADGTSQDANNKAPTKFHMKRSSKVKVKQLKKKNKGKNKRKSKEAGGGAAVSSTDAMEMEEE
ncbi:hypothetical protein M9H77_26202 [Catharanthus roseus]|uniref:Uncharacterized protein n=1 Tax=Catharanthus roseus TaxID=4058 RepID=A0ACC0A9V9_CATRO|nr:hypothetical protein M9H77_26202 [Catharanthus roseus]